MIEARALPIVDAVTVGAGVGEAGRDVGRFGRALEVVTMAARAHSGGALVLGRVAGGALGVGMRATKREGGQLVIEARGFPEASVVAGGAIRRIVPRLMVGIARRRIVGRVTRLAFRIDARELKLSGRARLVALTAIDRFVRTGEWEEGERVAAHHLVPLLECAG